MAYKQTILFLDKFSSGIFLRSYIVLKYELLHRYEVYPYGKIRKIMNIICTFELNFNISHVFCE